MLVFLFSFLTCMESSAQDLHYSQYFNSPLLLNPANTGFQVDNDWRAGINARRQWYHQLEQYPFQTYGVWADKQVFYDRFNNGWMGIGGSVVKDVAGSGVLATTKSFLSMAYHQMIGNTSLLSLGFGGGYVRKKIDYSGFLFGTQWNETFYDASLDSRESFPYQSIGYIDLQAGLNYAWFAPDESSYLNLGVSADHWNRPIESFYKEYDSSNKLGIRYNFFVNGLYKAGDRCLLNPNFFFSMQKKTTEWLMGINARYKLTSDNQTQIIVGGYYRWNDAVIPMVGVGWDNISLLYSLDVTTSKISYSSGKAHEISIIGQGLFSDGKATKIPCPHL